MQGLKSSLPSPPVSVIPQDIMQKQRGREAIGKFSIDQPVLPIAGAIFGGLVGSVLPGVGTILGSAGGGAIGGEAQIALKRMTGEEISPTQELKQVAIEGASAGIGEGIFKGAAILGKKALKPFAKQFLPEIEKIFAKHGIKAP